MPDLRMSRSPEVTRPGPLPTSRSDDAPTSTGSAPSAGLVRVARAGVLGGLSLLLATGAHLLGGGSLPGPGVLVVASVLLGLLAAVVTARRCRFGLLAVLLGVEQLALHELFSLAGAAQACTLRAAGSPYASHTEHHGVGHLVSACVSSGGMQMTSGVPGLVMWAAHLAAVLATAWLLARGEAWLWRAVDRVVAAAGLGGHRPTSPASAGRELTGQIEAVCRRPVYAAAAPRGPPHLLT